MRLDCPRDGSHLVAGDVRGARVWECARCKGRATTVDVVRRLSEERFAASIWIGSATAPEDGPACPACRRAMRHLRRGVELDVCRICHLVWFDAGELEAAPPPPPRPPDSEVRRRAELEAERIALPRRLDGLERENEKEGPDTVPQWIAFLLGLPVEATTIRAAERPTATWSVAVGIVLAFLATAPSLGRAIATYGFAPIEPFRWGGLTLVTAFFLHGGVYHVATNLYFLLVFGDDVESDLGAVGLIALLVASGLLGYLAYPFLDLGGDRPIIGASGGISGVLGYYALRFPLRRLYWAPSMLFLAVTRRPWLAPAWILLVAWLAVQAIGFTAEFGGVGEVAHLAHLAGAAVGIAVALWRRGSEHQSEGITPSR